MRNILFLAFLLLLIPACDKAEVTDDDPINGETEEPGDPGNWAFVESVNEPMQRHEHAYVAVGDMFYLVGGRGERPVQQYDPATKTWVDLAAPPFQMHHFQAVSYDGKVYVMGAFTEGFPDEKPIPHIYIFDPATNTWSQGPEIPEDRRRGAAGVVVHNDQFYIVAGITNGHLDGHVTWLDRYNPATDTWTQLADAPRARDHFHAAVIDGKLYAAGGRRSYHAIGQVADLTEAAVDVYDFESNTWTTLAQDLPTERAGSTSVEYDGRLVVIGGESVRRLPEDGNDGPSSAHFEVEVYDPSSGAWSELPSLLEGRHGAQAIVHNNMIYIAAGSRTLGGNEINSHEVYVP